MFGRRLLISTFVLLACSAFPPIPVATQETPSEARRSTSPKTLQVTLEQLPETATPQAVENASGYEVRLHPEDGIYVGELVSFEVLAPEGTDFRDQEIEIQVNAPSGQVLGPVEFRPFGIEGRAQATFLWEWETDTVGAGEHELTFSILPLGETWTESITILPTDEISTITATADWTEVTTNCCTVYYMTGTEAERDIELLTSQIDQQAAMAADALDADLGESISFVLMPRLLGHGGFASNEIYISYLDRNYAGENSSQIFHHEIVHVLDARLGGDLRPTMLVEGLAVYLSGGHFKYEPLMERAVALLELDWYIPFETLSDNFYFQQHEIGYLQAGALIEYMVERWGWPAYNDFYRDLHRHSSGSNYQAIDVGLRHHFNISFAELETQFLDTLRAQPAAPDLVADVRLTVAFYDTVRRYQQVHDPSAYFLTAWLLDIDEMQALDVTADYLRHPDEATNLTLETMLSSADSSLRDAQYAETERLLNAVNEVLDAQARGDAQPFNAHPLAAHYFHIVLTLQEGGFEPQAISIIDNSAQVLVSRNSAELISLTLSLDGDRWLFD